MHQLGRVQHYCDPLTPEQLVEHYGSGDIKEVSKDISRMGQRDLQAKFHQVYKTQSFSNNNSWLRRKLLEAAGIQNQKAGRTRIVSKVDRPAPCAPQGALGSKVRMSSSTTEASKSPAAASSSGTGPEGEPGVRRTKRARRPTVFYHASEDTTSSQELGSSSSSGYSEHVQDAGWFPDTGTSRPLVPPTDQRPSSLFSGMRTSHLLLKRKQEVPEPLFPAHARPVSHQVYKPYIGERSQYDQPYLPKPAYWPGNRVVSGSFQPPLSPYAYSPCGFPDLHPDLHLGPSGSPSHTASATTQACMADRMASLESCHGSLPLLVQELPAPFCAAGAQRSPMAGLSSCSSHSTLAALPPSPHQPPTPTGRIPTLAQAVHDDWSPVPATAAHPAMRLPGSATPAGPHNVRLDHGDLPLGPEDLGDAVLDDLLCSFDATQEPDSQLLHLAAAGMEPVNPEVKDAPALHSTLQF